MGRTFWWILGVVLAASVIAQLFVPARPHFEVESIFAFNAAYGFLACAALILVAKGIGRLVKRKDTYYDDDE